MKHILLVDDDALLRRSLAYNLTQAGYRTSDVGHVKQAQALIQTDPPDLLLLDIGLPDIDGLDFLRQLQASSNLPVIFLTARRRELDEVVGLELGAEDYVTKPFDLDVLLARIKVVLRRNQREPSSSERQRLAVGDLVIDPAAFEVQVAGQLVELAPREFDVLYMLAANAGNVVSVESLLNQVWGADYVGESQVVYVHIRWLREKLERTPNSPQRIVTVRGVGYKLIAH